MKHREEGKRCSGERRRNAQEKEKGTVRLKRGEEMLLQVRFGSEEKSWFGPKTRFREEKGRVRE